MGAEQSSPIQRQTRSNSSAGALTQFISEQTGLPSPHLPTSPPPALLLSASSSSSSSRPINPSRARSSSKSSLSCFFSPASASSNPNSPSRRMLPDLSTPSASSSSSAASSSSSSIEPPIPVPQEWSSTQIRKALRIGSMLPFLRDYALYDDSKHLKQCKTAASFAEVTSQQLKKAGHIAPEKAATATDMAIEMSVLLRCARLLATAQCQPLLLGPTSLSLLQQFPEEQGSLLPPSLLIDTRHLTTISPPNPFAARYLSNESYAPLLNHLEHEDPFHIQFNRPKPQSSGSHSPLLSSSPASPSSFNSSPPMSPSQSCPFPTVTARFSLAGLADDNISLHKSGSSLASKEPLRIEVKCSIFAPKDKVPIYDAALAGGRMVKKRPFFRLLLFLRHTAAASSLSSRSSCSPSPPCLVVLLPLSEDGRGAALLDDSSNGYADPVVMINFAALLTACSQLHLPIPPCGAHTFVSLVIGAAFSHLSSFSSNAGNPYVGSPVLRDSLKRTLDFIQSHSSASSPQSPVSPSIGHLSPLSIPTSPSLPSLSSPTPPVHDLPDDIFKVIMSYLSPADVLTLSITGGKVLRSLLIDDDLGYWQRACCAAVAGSSPYISSSSGSLSSSFMMLTLPRHVTSYRQLYARLILPHKTERLVQLYSHLQIAAVADAERLAETQQRTVFAEAAAREALRSWSKAHDNRNITNEHERRLATTLANSMSLTILGEPPLLQLTIDFLVLDHVTGRPRSLFLSFEFPTASSMHTLSSVSFSFEVFKLTPYLHGAPAPPKRIRRSVGARTVPLNLQAIQEMHHKVPGLFCGGQIRESTLLNMIQVTLKVISSFDSSYN